MTFQIELTQEEERRLASARARGIDPTAILKSIVASLPIDESSEGDRRAGLDVVRSYTGPRRPKEEIDPDLERERQAWDR